VKNREDLGPKGRLQSFPNVQNKRIHEFLFIGWQVTGVRSNALAAFERTSYLWSNAGSAFDRRYLRSNADNR
jgi:hypothetical protein